MKVHRKQSLLYLRRELCNFFIEKYYNNTFIDA